jgi:hypothetical protein
METDSGKHSDLHFRTFVDKPFFVLSFSEAYFRQYTMEKILFSKLDFEKQNLFRYTHIDFCDKKGLITQLAVIDSHAEKTL